MFDSSLKGRIGFMVDVCPVCGLRFLREAGYFLGAMYVSYGFGVATVLPVAILLAVVLEWNLALVLVLAVLQTLISVPVFFRYSRVIWLHADQMFDPR
jgi:uncharacterized protein (DUF2062 family)